VNCQGLLTYYGLDCLFREVSPDHTTITYSHIAFTLTETLFATPCSQQDGTGVMALFEMTSIRPMALTLSFMPEMKDMWPAPIFGEVSGEVS
jgi:hypothetical protein